MKNAPAINNLIKRNGGLKEKEDIMKNTMGEFHTLETPQKKIIHLRVPASEKHRNNRSSNTMSLSLNKSMTDQVTTKAQEGIIKTREAMHKLNEVRIDYHN